MIRNNFDRTCKIHSGRYIPPFRHGPFDIQGGGLGFLVWAKIFFSDKIGARLFFSPALRAGLFFLS